MPTSLVTIAIQNLRFSQWLSRLNGYLFQEVLCPMLLVSYVIVILFIPVHKEMCAHALITRNRAHFLIMRG
jgi:hypothetical protein